MSNDDTLIYGFIFFATVFILFFEIYRSHGDMWKLKRTIDKRREEDIGLMYAVVCNAFAQNCKHLFDAEIIKMPEDYEGTQEEIIVNSFFSLFPESRNYLTPKESGNDVRLEDSDGIS